MFQGDDEHALFEQYDFGMLDQEAKLNPDVAASAGITGVTSCEEARLFTAAANALPSRGGPDDVAPPTSDLQGVARAQFAELVGRPRSRDLTLDLARVRMLGESGGGLEGFDAARSLYSALLAVEHAKRVGDEAWRIRARGTRGLLRCATYWPGRTARGFAELEAACDEALRLGDPVSSRTCSSRWSSPTT